MKKIIALIAVLVALGVVAYTYFQKENSFDASATLQNAIPDHFPIALESANWTEVFEKVDTLSYGATIAQQDWFVGSKVYTQFGQKLQNLFATSNSEYGNTLLAYGNAGNSQLGILLAQQLTASTSVSNLKAILKKEGYNVSVHTFNDQEILAIANFEEMGTLSVTIYQGLLLCSLQPSFVEEAILSLEESSTNWQALKSELTGEQDFMLYVKPKALNYLASYLFKTNAIDVVDGLDNFTGNVALQLNFFEEEMSLSGYALTGEGTLLDTLHTAIPVDNFLLNKLPSNTALYTFIGYESGLENTTDYELKSMHSVLDGSACLYTLESFNEVLDNRKGALLSIKGEEYLNLFSTLDTELKKVKQIEDAPIYQAKLGAVLNKSFLQEAYFDSIVYFAELDDFIALSSTIAVVEQYLQSYNQASLMQQDLAQSDFKKSLGSKSNVDLFVNLSLLQPFLTSISTENSWQTLLGKLNLQFSNLGNGVYCQGKIDFHTKQLANTKTLWAVQLDTISTFKPQIVSNHNTNETEILVQDARNTLYLLNTSGEKIWKIAINGTIQSAIYQIDYYKNDKYQYVFNTDTRIYVVDRNGDNVDGFPIKLPSKAANPLLVINYDNAGIYRYMIACDNGNIYGYEQNGSPLEGWNPLKNIGIVTQAIQHKVYDGKDYIFFNNNAGKFYALNRKGENRFAPVQTKNAHNDFKLIDKLFVGGDKGMVAEIDLNGKLQSKTILDSSFVVFEAVQSIEQDTRAYAFASGSNFKFQLSQWKNFASYKTPSPIRKIESLVNNNNLWFLLYTNKEVYLIDETGNLHPDFPIASKGEIRLIYLIEGKDRILLYNDLDGYLRAKEIKWTN